MLRFIHYHGAASLEFIATAIPLLLLGLGGIEIAHWYSTRHMLNHALMLTARHAALNHAHPESIEQRFEEALDPLFAQTPSPSLYKQKYLHQTQSILQTAAWRIRVLSPNYAHFMDFHRETLEIAQQTGLPAIDNNYQKEQHQRLGIGLMSNDSIFSANTLSLSLSFPYQPIVPGMGLLFQQISEFFSDDYDKNIASHGYLPIQAQLSVMMQSHPVLWRTPDHGKIIYDDLVFTPLTHQESRECTGIWCLKKATKLYQPKKSDFPSPSSPPSSTPRLPSSPKDTPAPEENPTPPSLLLSSDTDIALWDSSSAEKKHPLCGISLCCPD